MNETRASRYHRARRRITAATLFVMTLLLAGLLTSGVSIVLRDFVGGSAGTYAVILVLVVQTALLPLVCLRVLVIDRRYGLWDLGAAASWRLLAIQMALSAVLAFPAAEILYAIVRTWPSAWWAPAGLAGAVMAAVGMTLAPVLAVPTVNRSRPLPPGPLRDRLAYLTERAGFDVAIHQWRDPLAAGRARAALAGAGRTRRVLLSSRLLEDFTDEEIEMIVAHELGHHANHDLLQSAAAELAVLLVGLQAAASVLGAWWMPLGLASPADPAGLPVIILAAAAVRIVALPLLNAWSRQAERRADRFALEMAPHTDAFVSAVRRMAAWNLAEERPSRAAVWLSHTHPTAEQRIADARNARPTRERSAGDTRSVTSAPKAEATHDATSLPPEGGSHTHDVTSA